MTKIWQNYKSNNYNSDYSKKKLKLFHFHFFFKFLWVWLFRAFLLHLMLHNELCTVITDKCLNTLLIKKTNLPKILKKKGKFWDTIFHWNHFWYSLFKTQWLLNKFKNNSLKFEKKTNVQLKVLVFQSALRCRLKILFKSVTFFF